MPSTERRERQRRAAAAAAALVQDPTTRADLERRLGDLSPGAMVRVAAALLADVAGMLDPEPHPCSSCKHVRYGDWPARQVQEHLERLAGSARKLAESEAVQDLEAAETAGNR